MLLDLQERWRHSSLKTPQLADDSGLRDSIKNACSLRRLHFLAEIPHLPAQTEERVQLDTNVGNVPTSHTTQKSTHTASSADRGEVLTAHSRGDTGSIYSTAQNSNGSKRHR